MALGGQAGLGDPSAVDRMQRLVEIRGSAFLQNADSEFKIQECRPNLSIFLGSESWCARLDIVENIHKGGF